MLNPYIEGWQLRELVIKRELRPKEVAEFFLGRIERLNPRLNAFITVTAERALTDAARLEKGNAAAMPLWRSLLLEGPDSDARNPHHLRLAQLRR